MSARSFSVDPEKKGLELTAAHFVWRKLGWATLRAKKKGIRISFDDFCRALAEFARERRGERNL